MELFLFVANGNKVLHRNGFYIC